MSKETITDYWQPLFSLMRQEHNKILLQSEMQDIINVVNKMQQPVAPPNGGEKLYRWVKASERLPKQVGEYFVKFNPTMPPVYDKSEVFEFDGQGFLTETDEIYYLQWLEELPSPTTEGLRTKEEILKECCPRYNSYTHKNIFKAMEEYKNQFKSFTPTEEEIREQWEQVYQKAKEALPSIVTIETSAVMKWLSVNYMIEKQNQK